MPNILSNIKSGVKNNKKSQNYLMENFWKKKEQKTVVIKHFFPLYEKTSKKKQKTKKTDGVNKLVNSFFN